MFFVIAVLGWSCSLLLIEFTENSFATDSHFRYLMIWLVIILFQSNHILHVASNSKKVINTCSKKLHLVWDKVRSKIFLAMHFVVLAFFFFFFFRVEGGEQVFFKKTALFKYTGFRNKLRNWDEIVIRMLGIRDDSHLFFFLFFLMLYRFTFHFTLHF